MSKKCGISKNKSGLVGNKVSHSNRKTKRKFHANIQKYSLKSDVLGCFIRLRAAPSSIRTVDSKFGLDNYLLNTKNSKLASPALKVKKRLLASMKKKEAATAA